MSASTVTVSSVVVLFSPAMVRSANLEILTILQVLSCVFSLVVYISAP